MKIKCVVCGNEVVEGEVVTNKNHKRIFDTGNNKPNGTILKNNSNNPDMWTGVCSGCQKNKAKEIKLK